MRIPLPLLAAAALLATPAVGEVFTGRESLHFSLSPGARTSPEDADLHVHAFGIAAPNGIRRSSRGGDFAQAEVTVLGEPYDLRDAGGGRWRMWIRAAAGDVLEVELVRARRTGPPVDRAFREAGVTIDGRRSEPTFDSLTLFANGSYLHGAVPGTYLSDEAGVTFSGALGQWGRAAYTANRDGLAFRFNRGLLLFEVRYAEQVNVAER